jgi:uncharacterized protein (TIGR02117 family)
MQAFDPKWRIFTLLSALALVACRDPAPAERPGTADTHVVYVDRRSWHIAIAFAAVDLKPPLAAVRSAFPSALYLEFGFGDRQYLTSRHPGAGTLLSALWPAPGLILMTALMASPQAAFGTDNVFELHLSARQAQQIQQFIWRTLVHDQNAVSALEAGPYEGSVFYAASAKYSAVRTCNTWAAQSLQTAGLPIHSTGVVFAGQLWPQIRSLAQAQDRASGRVD